MAARRSVAETPRTEHRGYGIYYTDNSEVWRCHELDLEAERLSQLKGKIDRALKKMRDADGVRCLYIESDGTAREALVVAVIERTRLEHTPYGNKDIRRVFLNWYGTRWRSTERSTLHTHQEIMQFAPDTPEVRDMIREAERRGAEIDALVGKRRAYIATIPRVTEDMFKALEKRKQ